MAAVFSEIKSAGKSARQTLKDQGFKRGFKTLWKCYGWKMVAAVLAYYIVRDVTLYILIPALVVKSLG